MSEKGEWKSVPKSGKSKGKGKNPQKPEKGNEKRPQTANETGSKTAVESLAKYESCPWLNLPSEDSDDGAKTAVESPAKDESLPWQNVPSEDSDDGAKTAVESPAKDESCPWLNVPSEGSVVTPKDAKAVESPAKDEYLPWLNVPSEDSDDGSKNTSTTKTNTPEKKKKSKKKKNKNKDKQESEHHAQTPKGDSAETTTPQVTNGEKPDSEKTTAPKSTKTKSEPQEATGEESVKTTTAKPPSESTKPDDDDDVPMNWEDAVVEQDKASKDKSHSVVADEEESSASQATAAEKTSKGKIPTDNSAGEGSHAKMMTDSGARDKPVRFGWNKKSHSNEKLQTGHGGPERERQGSGERKHNFKKPNTNSADDDDAPMNWEDAVVEQDKASKDKSHSVVADEEESSASQATAAEKTSKGKIPTDNSAGEGSPAKTMTDSGARDKPVRFGWNKKSHLNEKLQTGHGGPERERQGSGERKHNFKKPNTNSADDDDAPMNWEDAVIEQDKASEDKSHSVVADEEESSASQATAAEETSKGIIPTDNSAGEGSSSKTNTDSGAREKIKFTWNRPRSNERLQTGGPERERQGSTDRKHTFKKPNTNSADDDDDAPMNWEDAVVEQDNDDGALKHWEDAVVKQDNDDAPKNWEDAIIEQDKASEDKSHSVVADEEESSASRATAAEKTSKGIISTDNSAGEGSPSETITDSGARDKPVRFGWNKKSHSNEKVQTGGPERERQGSTDRKHTFKKPNTNSADDDDAPMNWEDAIIEQDMPSEDKLHSAVADEEESSASQATAAEETSKGIISTDNSAGEGSPSKTITDSGARDKPVRFGWNKKSHSNEKVQTGGPERERQGSTERKHTFKKPITSSADVISKSKRNASARDSSHERRSDSKDKGRQGSADRSRSESSKTSRIGSGSRKVHWELPGF